MAFKTITVKTESAQQLVDITRRSASWCGRAA